MGRHPPSKTPIYELANVGASISIDEGEFSVDLRPAFPVRLRWSDSEQKHEWEIISPQHETFVISYFDVTDAATDFDAFWATAGRLLSECQRVGDWIVGLDAETELGVDVENLDRDEDKEAIEEYREYLDNQRRQKLRVESPLEGISMTPPDPSIYYPWVDPLYRPIIYTYRPREGLDCPICGGYGRYGDSLHGIRCKTHGEFLTCKLGAEDNWVRSDDKSYREQFLNKTDSSIEEVRVARDGYLLTLRTEMGGRLQPRNLRRMGYDVAAGAYADRPGANRELWTGSISDETPNLEDIDEYEEGDRLVFCPKEILAQKHHSRDIRLNRKPWASGSELQKYFREYRQRNGLSHR